MTDKELIFGKSDERPVYQGKVVYRDVADNLAKIKFPVIVTESYNPNVHYSLLREGAPPPIYVPGPNEMDSECKAMLPGDFIIDALVTGQKLAFCKVDDMEILAGWIEQYIESYKGVDLTRYPERAAFLANAKKALSMMKSNISRKFNYERIKNPAPLTIAELIAYM